MSDRAAGKVPSLVEVISELIEERLRSFFTMLPGTVMALDKDKGLISVQPDFKAVYRDDPTNPKQLEQIHGVPVFELRSEGARIRIPVKVGSKVTLLFASRDLQRWKQTGKSDVPESDRFSDLSNAIAFPGLYSQVGALPLGDDLIVEHGAASVRLVEDSLIELKVKTGLFAVNDKGQFKLSNGSVDLLKQVSEELGRASDDLDATSKLTVPTQLGVSGVPVNAAVFTQAKLATDKAKKLLDQLLM